MKISISSYSFSRLINAGEMTQFDCIAKAKELGYEGIEFVDLIPHDNSSQEDYAKKLAEESARLSLPITNYTVSADFISGSGGDTKAEIELIKKKVDIAHILGTSSMRHDATAGRLAEKKSFDDILPFLADACREVTEYAKTKGIKTMVENHGFFCQDSARVEKLICAVNNENFGWLVDMGNFLCVDENPADAFGIASKYISYAHAKDFVVKSGNEFSPGSGFFTSRGGNYLKGTIVGHGNVPVVQCLSILKKSGYDGYLGVEFEGMEDVITALEINLENLKYYLEII